MIARADGYLIDVMLLTHSPGPPLSSYVETLWYYSAHQPAHTGRERVLPNGRFQIVIDLSSGGGIVSGMRSQHIAIEPAAIQCVIGVVFHPGGARGFLPVPSSDFYNRIVPLDAVWNWRFTALQNLLRAEASARRRLKLLEAALIERTRQSDHARFVLHPSVQHALRTFRRVPHVRTVSDVARDAGWSRRRLTQLFAEQVGMTPKLYCRVMRFRHVVRQVATGAPVDWADVAVAGGYCDQAHLAHEFRDFSGLSPTSYLEAERPSLNHVRID